MEGRPKPTPARSLAEVEAPTDAEPPTPAVEAELDGEAWTARVLGRSGGVRGLAIAPLMLLGFWRGPAADADGPPARELLTADRDLAALSPRELHDALLAASPPRASDRPKPFFTDPGDKRRR